MFEAPWLGFAGISPLVPGLERGEYEAIRLRTLQRWWNELDLFVRRKRPVATDRERSLAASFVVLKTGTSPESVRESLQRNELGDELYTLLYRRDG